VIRCNLALDHHPVLVEVTGRGRPLLRACSWRSLAMSRQTRPEHLASEPVALEGRQLDADLAAVGIARAARASPSGRVVPVAMRLDGANGRWELVELPY
jgi:hypothetical protein